MVQNWSQLEFGLRLKSFRPQVSVTLARAAHQISVQPAKSFSRCLGESLRKSCAHHLASDRMTPEVLLTNHYSETYSRMASSSGRDLLIAQDSVYFNYSGQSAMEGLQPLQDNVLGVVQHNALCIQADQGLPLGLVDLHNWTRGGHQDKYEVESEKWLSALDKLNAKADQLKEKRLFLIQDRECDWFEFFQCPRASNLLIINRIFQNRAFEFIDPDREVSRVDYLNNIIGSTPVLGTTIVSIQKANRKVNMTLELCFRCVSVYPPGNKSPRLHKTKELSLLIAREVAAYDQKGKSVYNPDNIAQWVLLTDLEIKSLEDAILITHYYAKRWTVERLHYTMKSGALKVENLQFDHVKTLCNALALYTLVAWRLLHLSMAAKAPQTQQADQYFEPVELEILQRQAGQSITTTAQAVQELGKIVGFVPRKEQSLPGLKILAEALLALNNIKSLWLKMNPLGKP